MIDEFETYMRHVVMEKEVRVAKSDKRCVIVT